VTESQFIDVITGIVPTLKSPQGPGDDGAVLSSGPSRVLSTDTMIEGTHFLRAHPPRALGWKVLAVNFSDVAAMGANPEAFVFSAALPENTPEAWWTAFSEGMAEYANRVGAVLVGGDIVRSPGPISLTVTAWGMCDDHEACLTRAAAQRGDVLMATGHFGRAAEGLNHWITTVSDQAWADAGDRVDPSDVVVLAFLKPDPPLWAGPWALAHGARAGMDCSDGLATDLGRLAHASQVGISVDLSQIPTDPAILATVTQRVVRGEDYGFVCCVPPHHVEAFQAKRFAQIGLVEEESGLRWHYDGLPVALDEDPFEHFSGS
jgi:thiamine-monophosphate kinase